MNRDSLDLGLPAALRARLLGAVVAAVGAVFLVVVLLVWLTPVPPAVLGVTAVLAVVALMVAGVVVLPRRSVLHADATGYRVRFIRGAGTRSARWTEVEQLTTTTDAAVRYIVLQLRDGRSTTIPVDLLAMDRERVVDELQDFLNDAHGYRPLS